MRAVIAEPAYWAFCWGSGLALAQEVLERPKWVQGQTVVDFGAGSGVVGIAAALAGATRVIACDSDPDARLACATNAALNGVQLEQCSSLEALPSTADRILLADVLYDRANLPLLAALEAHCASPGVLLIADSRIRSLESFGYQQKGAREALTLPNLGEFDEFRHVRFFAKS